MPFDGKTYPQSRVSFLTRLFARKPKPIPNLRVASVAALAYVLRHRETWPRDWLWSYKFHAHCAIGLATQLWGTEGFAQITAELGVDVSHRAFFLARRPLQDIHDVRPAQVARVIEKAIKKGVRKS